MIVCMTKLGSQIVKVVTCSTDFRVLIPELLPYKDPRPKTEERRPLQNEDPQVGDLENEELEGVLVFERSSLSRP